MIEVGKYQTLKIMRDKSVGLYLSDGEEDVLLPNKYVPKQFKIDDEIEVFVYRDFEERKVATTLHPKIKLNEFALLKVADVSHVGAFLDWGMEKELLVPNSEQRDAMRVNRWFVVRMCLDEETDRLYASNKIGKFLQNEELTVKENEQVNALVYHKSELGYNLIINNIHKGLIFNSDVFGDLNIGENIKCFIKTIREDNKLDVAMQPVGFAKSNDLNSQKIIDALNENNGELEVNDKSSPDEIYARFSMSKKAFKRAIGGLLKTKQIKFIDNGIALVNE